MNLTTKFSIFLLVLFLLPSCVSKKKLLEAQDLLAQSKMDLEKCGNVVDDYSARLETCNGQRDDLTAKLSASETELKLRNEQMSDLRAQIDDMRKQRDATQTTVTDLTVLSKSASDNIKNTLGQLESKDKYLRYLQNAKTQSDSINLALAVNLKGVLAQGIADNDINIQVDKTVVFINLSDKMLYRSGSSDINSQAMGVLGKIAKIIQSKPGLEVMIEGYTDNKPIARPGIQDNWDLSVKRATSVVRVLQNNFGIDPNRLIAAGRGEYNALASNDDELGRSANRRTRIIIMPKLNEFYDLLDPEKANPGVE